MTMLEEARREQARHLRYKKPLVQEIGLQEIRRSLYEMDETCGNVRWFLGDDESALEDILGEDDAYEFQMSFSALSADIERMTSSLDEIWLPEYFDDFLAACHPDGTDMMGYDVWEEDFFRLDSYEAEAACREAKKRIERKTKSELIDCAHTVIGVIVQYTAIKYRYDSLCAAYDVLMDRTKGSLQAIRHIEELYEAAEKQKFYEWAESTRQFENAIRDLPDQTWIE